MPILGDIYSRADALKRRFYDMISNPGDFASMVAGRTQEAANVARELQNQAFANQQRPLQVTNPEALQKLTDMMMAGPLGFAPAGITAYHGSPYLFRQFDPSKVGAGEGAQAYGVGAGYTAEARPVAEEYARNISRQKMMEGTVEGSPVQSMVGNMPIQDFYAKLDKQAARLPPKQSEDAYAKLDIVERLGLGTNVPDIRQYVKDSGYSKAVQNWVEKELIPKYKPAGYLYKGDIPDEILPKFLDWDAPIAKQSQEIKKFIETDPNAQAVIKQYPGIQIGAEFYNRLADVLEKKPFGQGNPSTATNYLEQAGIRGIRYLDQGSRDVGKGTSNFIPFRPEDYKIQEINDIPIEQYFQRGLLDRPMSPTEQAKAAWEANPNSKELYEAYRKLRLGE